MRLQMIISARYVLTSIAMGSSHTEHVGYQIYYYNLLHVSAITSIRAITDTRSVKHIFIS